MANQALQNLKKIHELQNGGKIIDILKDIRAAKGMVDEFSMQLSARKRQLDDEQRQQDATLASKIPAPQSNNVNDVKNDAPQKQDSTANAQVAAAQTDPTAQL